MGSLRRLGNSAVLVIGDRLHALEAGWRRRPLVLEPGPCRPSTFVVPSRKDNETNIHIVEGALPTLEDNEICPDGVSDGAD